MKKEFDMKKPPQVFYKSAPSEEFYQAVEEFFCHGSCRGWCDKCGRSFMDSSSRYDLEEGEEEEFDENAKKYPGWFLYYDYSVPICDNFLGNGYGVVDCPCNWMKPYEDAFWIYRSLIANYLKKRVAKQVKETNRNQEIADSINETLKGDVEK